MFVTAQVGETLDTMSDKTDLTGDGGVLKTIIRHAKPDALDPSESLPLVDGKFWIVSVILDMFYILGCLSL